MTFVVIYDANVLYGNTLRDLLIRLAMAGRVQARWTNEILDEMQRNLAGNRPDIPQEKLSNLRRLMNSARRVGVSRLPSGWLGRRGRWPEVVRFGLGSG